ncbi:MAG: Jag N-terminal domain-containing protein [Candidatus Muirbacterium halophilum]|nr:Jag N-terminal domain-containing protein [Candidatus Muirbacterium halophilum]MCK9475784.1 Jag N-terminal domain-containing protein [Candidatus Muirbacterium halophilum]
MKITIEAKSVDEAKKIALAELGTDNYHDISFEILSEESKGLFGFGGKKAKITAEFKKPYIFFAKEFISELLKKMGISGYSFESYDNGKDFNINIKLPLEFKSIIIGKFGQTVSAIEYITRIHVNRKISEEDKNGKYNLYVDVENYKHEKLQKLEKMAESLAEKVAISGKSVEMKPMSARERKIIHMNLKNNPEISTFSRGQEPYRKIIISKKK